MSMIVTTRSLYRIGDVVGVGGSYLCVPCGYVQYFKAGDNFITCEACFAGTGDGPEGYRETASEFWQFIG